ncbi:MAG TPA: VCBS repeat-containing protein [Planctomycetota bacterium]|nr:VCBS repeat-containing protein [Planctomycetota bacterium]
MRKYLLIIGLVFITLPLFAQRGDMDEETQPIGIEYFNTKDIAINGRLESFNLIDLNNDGVKEIIYIQIEDLSLEILSYDKSTSGYRLQQTMKIPAGVMVICIGNYLSFGATQDKQTSGLPAGLPTGQAGRHGKEIAFYTSDSVFCYKQNNSSIYIEEGIPLSSEPSIFYPPAQPETPPSETGINAIPLIKEGEDINNDGIDDLIIPTKDGYLICWGPYENAIPSKKQIIGQPAAQTIKTTDSSFITISASLPNILLKDLDGDGLKDVVLGFANRLIYYFQNKATGFFPAAPSGEFRLDFLTLPNNQGGSNILLYSNQFADLNADGFMDLVIASTSGDMSDIGNMVTRIFVFMANPVRDSGPYGPRESGTPSSTLPKDNAKEILPNKANVISNGASRAGRPIYSTPPAQVINLKGVCPLWGITEINGDNYPDLFITSFKVSLASNIKKAILRYIPITYQIYLNTGKNFPMAPDYERTVNFPSSALGKGTGYFSHIYFGYDYNNDNRTDLLTIAGPEKKKGAVTIYCGRQKNRLTKSNGVSFEKDEFLLYPARIPDKAVVADLNNDRKNDIILQYKSKLTVLIAK